MTRSPVKLNQFSLTIGLFSVAVVSIRTGVLAALYGSFLTVASLFFLPYPVFISVFLMVACGSIFFLSFVAIQPFGWIAHASEQFASGRLPIAIIRAGKFAAIRAQQLTASFLAPGDATCFFALLDQTVSRSEIPVLDWDRFNVLNRGTRVVRPRKELF